MTMTLCLEGQGTSCWSKLGLCRASILELPCACPCYLQQFEKFFKSVLGFAAVGIPAAVVNSGLKYMQKQIELAFQVGPGFSQLCLAPRHRQGLTTGGSGFTMEGMEACLVLMLPPLAFSSCCHAVARDGVPAQTVLLQPRVLCSLHTRR